MRKILLMAALMGATLAETAFAGAAYTYEATDEDGLTQPVYGSLRRVSPNGLWAAGGDEFDETGCFVINTSNPTEIMFNADGYLLDIDDNGMAVGAWYERVGYAKYKRAAMFRDGVWERLPLPEECIGQSYAVAISADSKVIAGHAMCLSEDGDGGKYFPIVWEENDGVWTIRKLYNNLVLPGTYGFFVYDMTPDGRYICGMQCLDASDPIAALLDTATEQYKIWHTIENRIVDFELGGQLYPFDAMFVDGYMDGSEAGIEFNGVFLYATNEYLFGSKAEVIVTEAQEEGEETAYTILNRAAVYDLNTREFTYGDVNARFMCGMGPEQHFSTRGQVSTTIDGTVQTMSIETMLSNAGINNARIDGIYSVDDAAKVLTGAYVFESPMGEQIESPVLVMLDNPVFTGITDVTVDRDSEIGVYSDNGTLEVRGATDIRIYNANGMLVSTGARTNVQPGVYIVVADGNVRKVNVR